MTSDKMFRFISEHISFLMALQQLRLPTVDLENIEWLSPVAKEKAIQRNQRKIATYSHRTAFTDALRAIVAECKAGSFAHADILGDLADTVHLGIDLAALGCTYAEVREWHRSFAIQYVRTLLAACREGRHEKIKELLDWIEVVKIAQPWAPPISLEELGMSEDELEKFRRMLSLFP